MRFIANSGKQVDTNGLPAVVFLTADRSLANFQGIATSPSIRMT
jgi:hypothetical protein